MTEVHGVGKLTNSGRQERKRKGGVNEKNVPIQVMPTRTHLSAGASPLNHTFNYGLIN